MAGRSLAQSRTEPLAPPSILTERHLPRFLSLTPEGCARVLRCIHRAVAATGENPGVVDPATVVDGQTVFDYCKEKKFDMCRTILALVGEGDVVGRAALEALHGRPILQWGPSVEEKLGITEEARAGAAPRNPERPAKAVDSRIVLSVAPNPRREGSEAYEGYAFWKEGDTVQQCVDRGLPARSLRRDVRHGHVKLGGV